MDGSDKSLSICLHERIADINPHAWDACAGGQNPFVSYAFLSALEDSGSTGPSTGWIPQYMTVLGREESIEACVPLYMKAHSLGEYVFDQGWAEAFERAGGNYYPKLQVASPFSPVPGPRLLKRPGSDISIDDISQCLEQACTSFDMSSVHVTFCQEDEWHGLSKAGWLRRLGTQFHWHNDGYQTFDDFLAALSSSHRKSIKRERRDANGCNLIFKTLSGSEIKDRHWDAFYRFYQATVDRKWGSAYLSRDFFSLLSERLGERVVLMVAEHEGELVAGALNLVGHDTLYGRNWGCVGQWPFLHFELCYYRAIDFAIAHGLKRVEAGAQGEHKIQRGYLPQSTYSAHWIASKGLSDAVADYLARERPAIEREIKALSELSPFRQKSS